MQKKISTIDGNEAAGYVAYKTNEVIAIYPITPASPMGEWADAWAAESKPNIWGTVPSVVELQSEGGAVGAIHGSLQTGSLSTTFTASQGLLLMIPNMYKIAGELTPTVFHIAARSLSAQALSIFGDHSDVMACRSTGWGMLCSCSVQEAMDFALIAQAVSLESRIPFLHFFDGFRTSHQIDKVEMISDEHMHTMISSDMVAKHRSRGLSPERPVVRGTAQNPDVYFQGRETVNKFYEACPEIVQKCMDKFASLTGRKYQAFEYYGAPDAEYVVVIMGSGAETAQETVDYLNQQGKKVGMIKVRLYRPFDNKRFLETLPATVKAISVLDRTKETGANGEPLYQDCITAIFEGMSKGCCKFKTAPVIVGGRYGLSSKEFTAAMVKAVFENIFQAQPKNHFTVGINDDVTHTSLTYDPNFSLEKDVMRAMFFGLGSDGTVSANKNSIKIIGENTDQYVQGYFVYDSKKAGAVTVSHLRFAKNPIHSIYLISKAQFVACHQHYFLEKYEMLDYVMEGGTFLLNTSYGPEEIWKHLPLPVQKQIIDKKVKLYVIDAYKVAEATGMGRLINTVMQVCFFGISQVLPKEEAVAAIKNAIRKTYEKKGEEVVQKNLKTVDETLAHLHEVKIPNTLESLVQLKPSIPESAPKFVREVLGTIIDRKGDSVPVSAMPCDGTYPSGTTKWEKRALALKMPVWEPSLCLQCGKCSMVCPHAVIRMKVYDPALLKDAPPTFKSVDAKDKEFKGSKFTIQIAPDDCTGCGVCVTACPAKSKDKPGMKAINMTPALDLRPTERPNWEFFYNLPEVDRRKLNLNKVRHQQFQQPLFEFSGACAGCGETPYLKLLTQLFGDRSIVANATGCSSIYGGNLPTTPWSHNKEGRGPAWCNSLFEDNAEFGFGMRVALDKQIELAREILAKISGEVGKELADSILNASQKDESEIYDQRERVKALKEKLASLTSTEARQLLTLADVLVKKDVWIVGGDGWAYDIGYGGLDHVLASGRNVKMLVLDTEVYSNTGGQASKATPLAAVARFTAGGKRTRKKDLGLMAMSYGNVYVAAVAFGSRDEHTLKAFLEAEAYDGPAIIIAYCHCIAHGIKDMGEPIGKPLENQDAAVKSGQWLLYRYNPDNLKKGEPALTVDSPEPELEVKDYLTMESRFNQLVQSKPDVAKVLFEQAQENVNDRYNFYQYMAEYNPAAEEEEGEGEGESQA